MTATTAPLATKSQFAAIIGRDPAFVTRAIQSGKITGAALVGKGRSARVVVDLARQQLGMVLDLSQQLAQARPILTTVLPVGATSAASDEDASEQHAARAEQIRLRNHKLRGEIEDAETERAINAGQLVDRHQVANALNRQLGFLASVFDEIPQALAKPLAEAFGLNYAEVLIAVKQALRAQRQTFADRALEIGASNPVTPPAPVAERELEDA